MAVMTLVALGLVMVYSASAITAQEKLGDGFYYLKRQAAAAGLGLLAMTLALRIGYRRLARLVYPLLVCVLVLLVVVLLPAVGTTVGGARRWIRLLGFSIQPAEIAKLAWVLYLAYSLAKKRERVALFSAGTRLSYLVGSVLLAMPVAYRAIASSSYRKKRILAFLDPWAHRHDAGYQVAESLMSIGSGGLLGLGLGDGRQKLFFLPEAHTDFVFSIIGEELGLVGVAVVLGLYAVIIWRGVRAS